MTETKTDYKETLNLPQTTLAMRANATQREPEIQKFWEENWSDVRFFLQTKILWKK